MSTMSQDRHHLSTQQTSPRCAEGAAPEREPRLDLSIAVNHNRQNRDTKERTQTGSIWIRTTLWEDFAEQAAQVLRMGMRVPARGRWETREFTTPDGQQGESFEMPADDFGPAIRKRHRQSLQGGGFGGGQHAPDGFGGQQASDPGGAGTGAGIVSRV